MMLALFIVLHLFLALWIILIVRIENGRYLVLTPFIIFISLEVVFSWNFWLLFQPSDVNVTDYSVIVSLVATASYLAGYMFFLTYERIRTGEFKEQSSPATFLKQPLIRSNSTSTYAVVLVMLVVFGCAVGVAYFRGVPPTMQAIKNLLTGSELEEIQAMVGAGRRELTKSYVFGGEYRGQGVLKSFMFTIWSYGLTLSLVLAFTEKRGIWYFFAFLYFWGVLYFIGGIGERSRLLWAFIVGFCGLSYAYRFNMRRLASAGIMLISILFLTTMVMPRYKVDVPTYNIPYQIAVSIVNRIFQGNKINNVRIINYMENGELSLTYGEEHLVMALNILPGIHNPPIGHKLGEMMGIRKTTYYSGTYLGDVYLDFGLPGTILIYLFLGMLSCWFFIVVLKMSKRIENIPFIAFIVYRLGEMSIGAGLITLMSGLVPVLLLHGFILMAIGLRPVLLKSTIKEKCL